MASDDEEEIQREHHAGEPGWLEKAAAQRPFGRLIEPNEVARAVAFLATDEAGLMTGSMVNFDPSVWGAYDSTPIRSARSEASCETKTLARTKPSHFSRASVALRMASAIASPALISQPTRQRWRGLGQPQRFEWGTAPDGRGALPMLPRFACIRSA
jgi:hypothetical protein